MKRKHNKSPSRRKTVWTGNPSATPQERFLDSLSLKTYDLKHLPPDETEQEMVNSHTPTECPRCGGTRFGKDGKTAGGIQRYRCYDPGCGCRFTVLTGTLFDNHKISLADFVEYVTQLFGYESFSAIARNNRNSDSTIRYWNRKIFLALAGCQDDVVLQGCVCIDEMFRTCARADMKLLPGGLKPRGHSVNQYCIGVACDRSHVYLKVQGRGHTSSRRTAECFGPHIRKGSFVIHDGEPCHGKLVEENKLVTAEVYSREERFLRNEENPLYPVNNLCSLVQKFLDAHPGFDRDELQGYLDVVAFVSNTPGTMYEKVDKLLSGIFALPKTLRYRDQYSNKRGK